MTNDEMRTEFWVSLLGDDGAELAYPGYFRQRVFERDGVWQHIGGPLVERPVSFPPTAGRTRDAAAYGVSLTRDSEPVFAAELAPRIVLDLDRPPGGITPQVVHAPVVYEVLRRARFPRSGTHAIAEERSVLRLVEEVARACPAGFPVAMTDPVARLREMLVVLGVLER